MFKIQTKNWLFIPFDREEEKVWSGPFYFIQCADTQFGMENDFKRKEDSSVVPGCDAEIMWSTKLVEDIEKMTPKPKFAVVCGDLLDAFPVIKEEARKTQEVEFKKVFTKLSIPLVCVCGNHDVGDQPTYETLNTYRSSFGDDYFSFWCGGVFFIALNSQFYQDASKVQKQAEEQEKWLDDQLELCQRYHPKHIVCFQHIPPFLRSPDEGRDYFNLEMPIRMKFLDKLYKAGVRHVYCGHYHRNAGGFYKDLECVVTSAVGKQLGEDINGFRIVSVYDSKIKHTYYDLWNAPTSVCLDQST